MKIPFLTSSLTILILGVFLVTPVVAAEGDLVWQHDRIAGWPVYFSADVTTDGVFAGLREAGNTVRVIKRTADNASGDTGTFSVPTGAWGGAYPPYIAADSSGVYVALTSALDASLNYGTLSIAKLSPIDLSVIQRVDSVTPGFVNVSRVEIDSTGVYIIGGASAPNNGWRVEKWDKGLLGANPIWSYDSKQSGGNACDNWGPRTSAINTTSLYLGGCRLNAGLGTLGNRIEKINKNTGVADWVRLEPYGTGSVGAMTLDSTNLYTSSANAFWGGVAVPQPSRFEKRPLSDAPAIWTINETDKTIIALATDGTSGVYRGYLDIGDTTYSLMIDKTNFSDGSQTGTKTISTGVSSLMNHYAGFGPYLIINNLVTDNSGIYVTGRDNGPYVPFGSKIPRIEKYGLLGLQDCGQITDSRDGNVYDTVVIGSQCWMKENMRVGSMIPISTGQTNNSVIQKYCYGDNLANCMTVNHPNYPDGGLYNWDEAMQYASGEGVQGICPGGWHIPTDAEWYTLENYLKDVGQTCNASRTGYDCSTGGTKLKSGGASGFEGNLSGTGSMGSGSFSNRNTYGVFWSSDAALPFAFHATRQLEATHVTIYRQPVIGSIAHSVRCVQGALASTPDLTAANIAPVTGTSFTTTQNITFLGAAVNSAAAIIADGGWAGLEIDSNLDGTVDDYYAIPDSSTKLGSFALSETKNLSYTLSAGTLPAGTYQYRFNVDSTNLLTETDDVNNQSPWVQFIVTVASASSADLTPAGCLDGIPYNASTCTASIDWTFYGVPAPAVYEVKKSNSAGVSTIGTTITSGGYQNFTGLYTYGLNTITAIGNGTTLNTQSRNIGCKVGSVWYGATGTCYPAPDIDITATPALIRYDSQTDVAVTVTNSAEPLDCKILNATTAPIVFTHTGTPQTKTYTYSTRNLTAAQIVTFSCTHQPTSQTSTVDVRIEVLPKIQEI